MDPMDPMRWWFDWMAVATGANVGAARTPPSTPPNPFAGMFTNPFASATSNAMPNPLESWQRWLAAMPLLALNPAAFGAAAGTPFGQSAGSGSEWLDPFGLMARWREMLTASSAPAEPLGASAADPWAAFRQWYERASAAASPALGEMLRSDAFAQASGAFLESASMAQRALRRASETQLAALGMPSRGDVARVANLVVQVEAKVDRIEEALEGGQDRRAAELAARDDGLAALEQRVERIEARLDRLLSLVEELDERQRRTRPDAPASTTPPPASNGTGAPRAHKPSTTRSRRKPASAS